MTQTTLFSHQELGIFIKEVFQTFGILKHDAIQASEILVASDLRGIDSHGVARLRKYVEMLDEGHINPNPNITIVREMMTTATVDGDNGLGLVVGPWANRLAMRKARKTGSGWVSVMNTNHFGIAGYYPMQALQYDLIGWAMTNTGKWMSPVFGAERMLGTNPIAIAFPGKEEAPVVIDLATSAASFGKVQIKQREGKMLPEGWITDTEGRPATDPARLIEGGTLLPLGSNRETGSHKGYCLASMVDILTAVLSGANWGPFAPPFASRLFVPEKSVGKGIGHFFGALAIEGFMDVDEFKTRMDEWIRTFRASRPAAGTSGPMVPGDPERIAETDRRQNGIPIIQPVVDDLLWVAEKTGTILEIKNEE